jgi:ABC-2 type transport system ATP-binding protein
MVMDGNNSGAEAGDFAVGGEGGVVVRVAGLTKVFRDFWMRDRVVAVSGMDLEVRGGEVLGLLGPNGSGKSTTIKMLLGLLHPTGGRVSVLGRLPADVATKRLIGYLPEESYLYRFLNAEETLDYYGQLFGLPRRVRKKRIEMLLEMVGLSAVRYRAVGEYSKGMQRRIGLAQALINDPRLLILDEPTSGLDPIGTRQIKDVILELSGRGKTILLCSHLLADVEDVCDRVAIMFGGKVRAMGTVEELLVKRDATTIHTQGLDERTVADIEALLRASGKHIDKVERPRQRLESLFLEIVRRAQEEGASTSGARSGGRIAAFLTEDGEVEGGGADHRGHEKAVDKRLITELVRGEVQGEVGSVLVGNVGAGAMMGSGRGDGEGLADVVEGSGAGVRGQPDESLIESLSKPRGGAKGAGGA